MPELYQVPVEGGRTRQIIATPAENEDSEEHLFMDGGDDDWVDLYVPHDFSNGDCICGEKAPN